MNNPIYRIILVDDHPLTRLGLKVTIEANRSFEGRVIKELTNGVELLEQIDTLAPDLILLDLRMPDLNGLEALKALRRQKCKSKILVYSMLTDAGIREAVFRAGADGYVSKQSTVEVLAKAIPKVIHGEYYADSLVQHSTLLSPKEEALAGLTPRELEVLRLIVKPHSNQQIARVLSISAQTVSVHRKNIIRKLGAGNTVGLIHLAIKNQLV